MREGQRRQRREYDNHEVHERRTGPRLGFLAIDGQCDHQDDGRVDQPVRIKIDSPYVQLGVLLVVFALLLHRSSLATTQGFVRLSGVGRVPDADHLRVRAGPPNFPRTRNLPRSRLPQPTRRVQA